MGLIPLDSLKQLNHEGFVALSMRGLKIFGLGEQVYFGFDKNYQAPDRENYFNELAFNWGGDDKRAARGFHDEKTLKSIHSLETAKGILNNIVSADIVSELLHFLVWVKESCLQLDPELAVSRCMIRQYNQLEKAQPRFSSWHEDQGWSDREYQQHLTAAITLYGIPTEAKRHKVEVGDLLVFNAKDRRIALKLDDSKVFLHRGPKHGPKLFIFWEFLKSKSRSAVHG